MPTRPPRFSGVLVGARPTRGPQNKDWLLEDLHRLAPQLAGTQVLYDHGDDPVVQNRRIGTIQRAYVDASALKVEGSLHDEHVLGSDLFWRIRGELVDRKLPMLSIAWKASTAFPTADDREKVALPESRAVNEISLVRRGYYPEARIMEVQCTGDRLQWKSTADIYTDPASAPTSTMATEAPRTSGHERIIRELQRSGKLSPEQIETIRGDPARMLDLYDAMFTETHKNLELYEKKEKRTRDAYSQEQSKAADELGTQLGDIWTEEERETNRDEFRKLAADWERQSLWQKTVAPLARGLVKERQQNKELQAALAKVQPTTEPAPATTMAMAASAERNEQQAKRPMLMGASAIPSFADDTPYARAIDDVIRGLQSRK